jgi:hypothetical protein
MKNIKNYSCSDLAYVLMLNPDINYALNISYYLLNTCSFNSTESKVFNSFINTLNSFNVTETNQRQAGTLFSSNYSYGTILNQMNNLVNNYVLTWSDCAYYLMFNTQTEYIYELSQVILPNLKGPERTEFQAFFNTIPLPTRPAPTTTPAPTTLNMSIYIQTPNNTIGYAIDPKYVPPGADFYNIQSVPGGTTFLGYPLSNNQQAILNAFKMLGNLLINWYHLNLSILNLF